MLLSEAPPQRKAAFLSDLWGEKAYLSVIKTFESKEEHAEDYRYLLTGDRKNKAFFSWQILKDLSREKFTF